MKDSIEDSKPHIHLSFSEHKAIKHWVNLVDCFASNENSGKELCESYAVSILTNYFNVFITCDISGKFKSKKMSGSSTYNKYNVGTTLPCRII